MEFGYVDDTLNIEISDEEINKKLEEIINKPDSMVATKKDLDDLKNNLNISMDFGVF